MKLELIKETRQYTGKEIWYVEMDGCYVDSSLTLTHDEAIKKFHDIIDKIDKFPETKKEVISTTLFMEKTQTLTQ